MVERHCAQAARVAEGLREAGFTLLNRVVLNQVLVRDDSDERTVAVREAAQRSGQIWFGPTVWQGSPAFRISVSSWRTGDEHIEAAIRLLGELRGAEGKTPERA